MSETALTRFARLESLGTWLPEPGARRVNVLVSFGAATLVITDQAEQPLSHWSLAAVTRVNPGERPALYAPSAEATELLEIDDDTMIDALETVRRATLRQQPHGGRLRRAIAVAVILGSLAVAAVWGPDALRSHAERSLPDAARAEIGETLLQALIRVGGAPCRSVAGDAALSRLSTRLTGSDALRLVVLRQGPAHALPLPGNTLVLDRRMVEDHESADVVSGYVLAGLTQAMAQDPLRYILQQAGITGTARLLTTGTLPAGLYAKHAEHLMRSAAAPGLGETDSLLRRFAAAQVPTSPYAYALDITGETTLPLIEADALSSGTTPPILRDRDWLALQGICE